jgi:calcium channel MID1
MYFNVGITSSTCKHAPAHEAGAYAPATLTLPKAGRFWYKRSKVSLILNSPDIRYNTLGWSLRLDAATSGQTIQYLLHNKSRNKRDSRPQIRLSALARIAIQERLSFHNYIMLCKCPHLTPLQSRLAASILSLVLVAIVFYTLSSPRFAYALELSEDGAGNSRPGEDHNWHRIEDERLVVDGLETDLERETDSLLARQTNEQPDIVAISGNNEPNQLNIEAGQTSRWSYSERLLHGPYGENGVGLPTPLFAAKEVEAVEHNELRRRNEEDDGSLDIMEKRQTSSEPRNIFVSMNTCVQPTYNGTGTQSGAPPQLTLYVATSANNQNPGPGSSGEQSIVPLDQGFAHINITASTNVFMAVHAPPLPTDFTGVWNYELAVSIDDYYHRAQNTTPFLFLVDTDTTAALMVTDNLTQADAQDDEYKDWMRASNPFMVFVSNTNYTKDLGLERSFCGLKNNAQSQSRSNDPNGTITHVAMDMTNRGLGNKPKQQFYVSALNSSSGYNGRLAMDGNSTASGKGVIGGGGTVWPSMGLVTKSDGNCALMFDLEFCSEVAYAVPANTAIYSDRSALAARYDSYAADLYKNFTYSMEQIACNASSDSRYSPAVGCDDCTAAYKEWLCAVSIPRCEDYSAGYEWLQPRNVGGRYSNGTYLADDILSSSYLPMSGAPTLPGSPAWSQTLNSTFATNRSRNHEIIDLDIMPGPYKEVLPCEDLCYSLVQKCPAALGIGCPAKGRGLEVSYGTRDDPEMVKCSYLGAVYYHNTAGIVGRNVGVATVIALIVVLVLAQ